MLFNTYLLECNAKINYLVTAEPLIAKKLDCFLTHWIPAALILVETGFIQTFKIYNGPYNLLDTRVKVLSWVPTGCQKVAPMEEQSSGILVEVTKSSFFSDSSPRACSRYEQTVCSERIFARTNFREFKTEWTFSSNWCCIRVALLTG